MEKKYTITQMKKAFEDTLKKKVPKDFYDIAWDLFADFEKEIGEIK